MGLHVKKTTETLLHNKLKTIYREQDEIKSEFEIKLSNRKYRLDLFDKEKGLVFEIQRASFGGVFSKKIQNLLDHNFRVRIIHPIILKQKISRFNNEEMISKSYRNRHTTFLNFFENLVYFKVPFQKNLEFDVLLVYEHLFREFIGYSKWSSRRKFQTANRDLIKIEKTLKIRRKQDFLSFLPSNLPIPFTNNDIFRKLRFSHKSRRNLRIPGQLTYSLCQLGLLKRIGKKGNAHLFDFNN
ncbi:MAG: hypothetical protein ACXACP_00015 [Candidatus Hodarchaeales archaeon]|jgi:hypothetical protein